MKLKGEVRLLPRPNPSSSQLCISLTAPPRSTASSRPGTKNTNPTSSNSEILRLSTGGTRGYSSACVSTPMTTSLRIWRRYIFSSRCWIVSLGMCVSWIWCLIFTRYALPARGSGFGVEEEGGRRRQRTDGGKGKWKEDMDTNGLTRLGLRDTRRGVPSW